MDLDSDILEIIVLLILFIVSGSIAGSQQAFFAFSDKDVKQLRKKASKQSKRTIELLSQKKRLFLTLKIGEGIHHVATIFLSLLLSKSLVSSTKLSSLFFFVVAFILILSALTVIRALGLRLLFFRNPKKAAQLLSLPVYVFSALMGPFLRPIGAISKLILLPNEIKRNEAYLRQQQIIALVNENEKKRNLDENEREMIHSIFELGETEVHEIMVPRTDMVCVEENTSLQEITKLVATKGHTRIPLYSESVDNILGIIHAKDLLAHLTRKSNKPLKLRSIARPAYFIPESKKLHHLLKDMQQEKYHMTIVVDEYGGTAGLVTLEDVIEEIIGDIQDEYDQEVPLYRKINENTFLVDAKIDIQELNELLDIELPTEGEYESLGGFILNLTSYVPEEKEVVKYDGLTFVVEKVLRNRIIRIMLCKTPARVDSENNSKTEKHSKL
ncbi:MAG: hemolysin family protein [bacterium]